jgi:hypothetical protein
MNDLVTIHNYLPQMAGVMSRPFGGVLPRYSTLSTICISSYTESDILYRQWS